MHTQEIIFGAKGPFAVEIRTPPGDYALTAYFPRVTRLRLDALSRWYCHLRLTPGPITGTLGLMERTLGTDFEVPIASRERFESACYQWRYPPTEGIQLAILGAYHSFKLQCQLRLQQYWKALRQRFLHDVSDQLWFFTGISCC